MGGGLCVNGGMKIFTISLFLSQTENYVPFISPKLVNPREKKISPQTLSLSHPKKFQNPKKSSPFSILLSLSTLSLSLYLYLSLFRRSGQPKGTAGQGRPAMGATAAHGPRPAMEQGEVREFSKKNFFFLFLQIIDGMSLDLLVLIDFR